MLLVGCMMDPMDIVGKAKEDASLPKGTSYFLSIFITLEGTSYYNFKFVDAVQ